MKRLLLMKRFLFLLLAFGWLIGGCAHFDPAGPQSEREAFPSRNQDSRWGLIINEGTTHLNFFVYDQAGRLVEQGYLTGANKFLTINGQNVPRYWFRQLDFGWYRVEIFPFYYQTDLVGPLFGKSFRYRIDLPKQESSISVGRNPTATYDWGYYGIGGTYRHWGWICRLNSGQIPATTGLPGIRINLQGNFR